MPFPAMPFGGMRTAMLSSLFKVAGLPTLVLLNADGSLVSTDGVRLPTKQPHTLWVIPPHPYHPMGHPMGHPTPTTLSVTQSLCRR